MCTHPSPRIRGEGEAGAHPEDPGVVVGMPSDDRVPGYGYGDRIDAIRREEFSRLHAAGVTYADHAGAPPHSEALVRECAAMMEATLLGNPHSGGGGGGDLNVRSSSSASSGSIEAARCATLEHFNAPCGEYAVVFTSGATAALRLVAESFPWTSNSTLQYTRSNHSSVLGMRGPAAAAGARVASVDILDGGRNADSDGGRGGNTWETARWRIVERALVHPGGGDDDGREHNSLFAYPAECNLSGERYDAGVAAVARAQGGTGGGRGDGRRGGRLEKVPGEVEARGQGRRRTGEGEGAPSGVGGVGEDEGRGRSRHTWWVLCDAAKAAALVPPDLSLPGAPDFLVCSFYKIFGYPTGVGALVVRRSALALLRPRYFGGGTAAAIDADEDFYRRRPGPEGLEDGTLPFSSIAMIPLGFRRLALLASPEAHDGRDSCATRGKMTGGCVGNRSPTAGSTLGAKPRPPESDCRAATAFLDWASEGETTGHGSRGSRAGAAAADAHASAVAGRAARRLAALRHGGGDGPPAVVLYGTGWTALNDPAVDVDVDSVVAPEPVVATPVSAGGVIGQGPTVAFNVRRPDGSFVGYAQVERLAAVSGVHLRVGCCCNPGGCEAAVRGPEGRPRALHKLGKVCGDGMDVDELGVPTGVVRASFGYSSTMEDADRLVAVIEEYFVAGPRIVAEVTTPVGEPAGEGGLRSESLVAAVSSIAVYPIKSAAGFHPPAGAWPLGANGLLFDREWALVSPTGTVLQQRQVPALGSLIPELDLAAGVMRVTVRDFPSVGTRSRDGDTRRASGALEIPLWEVPGGEVEGSGDWEARCPFTAREAAESQATDGSAGTTGAVSTTHGAAAERLRVRLCGEDATVVREKGAAAGPNNRSSATTATNAIDAWFSEALGVSCSFVRCTSGSRRSVVAGLRGGRNPSPLPSRTTSGSDAAHGAAGASPPRPPPTIGLANSAQILLVSEASVAHLEARVKAGRAGGDEGSIGGGRGSIPAGDTVRNSGKGGMPVPTAGFGCATDPSAAIVDAWRFRPNIVVAAVEADDPSSDPTHPNLPPRLEAYAEESETWSFIRIRRVRLGTESGGGDEAREDPRGSGARLVAVKRCERCSMVNINPRDGTRTPEPMLSLASFRAEQAAAAVAAGGEEGTKQGGGGGGAVTFGMLFNIATAAGTAASDGAHSHARPTAPRATPSCSSPGSVSWMRDMWGSDNLLSVGDGVFTVRDVHRVMSAA